MSKIPIPRKDRLAASGAWGTVEFALTANGKMPAKEFFESLSKDDQAKFAALFKWMADNGRICGETKFKHEQGRLFTFKKKTAGGQLVRFPCFQIGNRWILTDGFFKPKKDTWHKEAFTRAERIMADHFKWEEIEKANEPVNKSKRH